MFTPITGRSVGRGWEQQNPNESCGTWDRNSLAFAHLGVETDLDLVDLQVSWVALLRGTTKINLRFDFFQNVRKKKTSSTWDSFFFFRVFKPPEFPLDRRRFVTSTNYRVIGFVESSDIFGYLRCFEKTLGPRNLRPKHPIQIQTPKPTNTGAHRNRTDLGRSADLVTVSRSC